MNLDRIRKMNDDDLRKYLQSLNKRDVYVCSKCGNSSSKIIKVTNGNSTKQLCGLCKKCYDEMLDFIKVNDFVD